MMTLAALMAALEEGHKRLPDRDVSVNAYITVGLIILFLVAIFLYLIVRDLRR
jgi:hypothetical protein